MGTSFSTVADLFLSSIQDYRLDTLYNTSGSEALGIYIEPWLLRSIQDFHICDQSLAYTPIVSGSCDGYFTEDLTTENQIMLAACMERYWFQKDLNNTLYLNNVLSDHDMRTFSPPQVMNAKRELYNAKKEEISQMLIEYGYKHNAWSSWNNQIYGSG